MVSALTEGTSAVSGASPRVGLKVGFVARSTVFAPRTDPRPRFVLPQALEWRVCRSQALDVPFHL